ncbi:Crp/Fnr family transcriptional regulator [Candidatus Bipolaricaulota bacterium]|nr:Crp/Fnr family transcriptional regulator [Candidatus Bipolaricaulota bacterium]
MLGAFPALWERLRNLAEVFPVNYRAGELIFPEGGFAAGTYIVGQGLVGLFRSHGTKNVCLYVAGPGELLGLEAWLDNVPPQHLTAGRALTDVNLIFLPTPAWKKALEDQEVRKLVFSCLAQMWFDVLEREAYKADAQAAVLWAFQRWGEETPQGVRLSLNPNVLAMVLGLSRTAVKQALVRLGITEGERHLILDKRNLAKAPAFTKSPQ